MYTLICEEARKNSGLSQKELDEYIEIAKSSALLGGEILMKYYRKINTISNKSNYGDLVTNADIEAEKAIVSLLNKATPNIGIFAEEGGISGPGSNLKWCIDPLDGTTNYAHGYPFFATSIGLTWNDNSILGAIAVPFFSELYWAVPGQGSYCNSTKIRVSSSKELKDSLLVTGFAYDRHTTIDNNYAEFCWLTHRTRGVRRAGAAAVDMAFVAKGIIDGYWERGLSPWDLAAGIPIVELAGGVIGDYKNEKFILSQGRIIATNPYIQKELLSELSKVKPLESTTYLS